MVDRNVVDFRTQAEQMLALIDERLKTGQHNVAIETLALKFKALYEQGILSGQAYESEGIFPYRSYNTDLEDNQR